MKYFIILACLLPAIAFGQTQKDYDQAMARFVRLYNAQKGDSINASFGHKTNIWSNSETASLIEKYGTIKSFKFLGVDHEDPNNVYVYITLFSKAGEKTTSFTIDKQSYFGTFRFITMSDGIEAMLKKKK